MSDTIRDALEIIEKHSEPGTMAYIQARRALALLPQSPEGMGWQPIETAPKDGTPILILDMNGESIEITEWCTHKWTDYEHVEGELYRKVETESTYWNGNGHRATHWMPLPPPPAVSSHSQEEEMGDE